MIKKIFKRFKNNPTNNQQGSVMIVSLIVMLVLATSVAAISQVTANQLQNTSIVINNVNDESNGEKLILQAITEFKNFMDPAVSPSGTFDSTEYNSLLASFLTNYNVTAEDVTAAPFGPSADGNGESRAYKFSYPLETNRDLIMYAYVSTAGEVSEDIQVMDFSVASNGDIILNGGYYLNATFYGENIRYGQVSPYVNQYTGNPTLTPESTFYTAINQEYFPEFAYGGGTADIYYSKSFTFCGSTCLVVGSTINDNTVINELGYDPIAGSGLETGNIAEETIIGDFFGSYSLEDEILSYVRYDGPTEGRTIDAEDPLTFDNMGDEIIQYYSSEVYESCQWVRRNKKKWDFICTEYVSNLQYSEVTNYENFDPTNEDTDLDYAGIYDGNLIINNDFIINNGDTETFIVNGDLTFQNTSDIYVEGMFVVLGDLKFEGDSVEISGGFYVTGESRFNFDAYEGIRSGSKWNEWSFGLYSRKSVIVESMWESHGWNPSYEVIDMYIYTDESIYIDAVNSLIYIEGNLHARAKGLYGPFIMLENQETPTPVQIHGIVINAFNGYISSNGTPYFNYYLERFILDSESNVNNNGGGWGGGGNGGQSPGFIEEPDWDPLIVSEGAYSFETSGFIYEDN